MYILNKNLFKFSNLDTRVMYTGGYRQTNTCSKSTIETREKGKKYLQS